MKKITLLFSLVFCVGLNAQVLSEDFDALAIPAGWTNEYVSAMVDWQFVDENNPAAAFAAPPQTVTPRTGAGMAAFWSNNYAGDATRLVTPSMDLSVLPPQSMTFYYTQPDWGGDQDVLRVYYKTSAAGAWTLLGEYLNDTNTVWTEVNLLLPNPSADYYVAFEATSGYGYGVTIDDLVIDNAPNCLTPGSLSVFATSSTEANLNWVITGSETDFTYEYGAPGFTVDNSEEIGTGSVMGNSASISGLTAGTDYEFYVQANCGVDGDSGWAGPFAWTQPDNGESCGTAIVATLEADCGTATPVTLDFTGAPSNISTSCDTFNNYGLWLTTTTDASGGITVNASGAVDMAVYDMCGGTDVACYDGSIDPSTDVLLAPNTQYYLYFWQEGQVNTDVVDICITSFTPPMAPDCAEAPTMPADMETGVVIPDGDITITWSAPSSGPAPTDYEFFFGTESGNLASLGFVGSTDTFIDLINLVESTEYFWSVVPYNGVVPAVGPCSEWSFTTQDPPPPPANDNACDAIMLNIGDASTGGFYTNVSATLEASEVPGSCYFGTPSASETVWFSFVAPASGQVLISTEDTGTGATLDDTQITLFNIVDCTDLTTAFELACDEDDDADVVGDGAGLQANLLATNLDAGVTYYFVVDGYTTDVGTFDVSIADPTLSVQSFENENAFTYFPNPVDNELKLNAQKDIQNVTVFNMLGQEVLRIAPNAVESTVDMSGFSQGAYFVQVSIGNTTETIRVIKN